jgi:hypothetical protein
MRHSEKAYRKAVKRNWLTGEILDTEILIGDSRAGMFCDIRNRKLTQREKENQIAWYIVGPARGPVTIRVRRKHALQSGRRRQRIR